MGSTHPISHLTSPEDIAAALAGPEEHKHLCVPLDDGQSITVLTNGDVGWMMYLREPGDVGFSSRNPDYAEATGNLAYVLDNGQEDEHPASWAYPVAVIEKALAEFMDRGRIPTCVCWHDDSLGEEEGL